MTKTLIRLMALVGLLASANAQAITIDGNLADWGLHRTGQASDWLPDANIVHHEPICG